MVRVTRFNGSNFYINPDLIEFIEETPDTVITLTTGIKVVVTDKAANILEDIIEYRHKVLTGLPRIKHNE